MKNGKLHFVYHSVPLIHFICERIHLLSMHACLVINIMYNMPICVSVYDLFTGWCSGGELRVKVKSVFRSSDCWFERRPHFLPVQLLQKTTTVGANFTRQHNIEVMLLVLFSKMKLCQQNFAFFPLNSFVKVSGNMAFIPQQTHILRLKFNEEVKEQSKLEESRVKENKENKENDN